MQVSFKFPTIISAIILLIAFSACKSKSKLTFAPPKQKTEAEVMAMKSTIDQYFALSEGTFVVSGPAKDNSTVEDLYIFNEIAIFKEEWGKHWLYLEGSMVKLIDEPFDQAVLEVTKHSRDTMYVYSYRIKEPERFILGWYYTDKLKALSKEDLIPSNEGCNMIVVQKSPGVYETVDKGLCPLVDGNGNHAYTHTTMTLNYEGSCGLSIWYNSKREVSGKPKEECAMYKRDVSGKYHKLLFEKKQSVQKE